MCQGGDAHVRSARQCDAVSRTTAGYARRSSVTGPAPCEGGISEGAFHPGTQPTKGRTQNMTRPATAFSPQVVGRRVATGQSGTTGLRQIDKPGASP